MLVNGVYTTRPLNGLEVEEISNIKCQLSSRQTPLHEKIFTGKTANIYVRIFVNLQQLWFLV